MRSEQRKVVGLVVWQPALAAKEFANFRDSFADLIGIPGLGENHIVLPVGIEFTQRGDRHVCGVVLRVGTAGDALPLLLYRANNREELAVDDHLLAQAILR